MVRRTHGGLGQGWGGTLIWAQGVDLLHGLSQGHSPVERDVVVLEARDREEERGRLGGGDSGARLVLLCTLVAAGKNRTALAEILK